MSDQLQARLPFDAAQRPDRDVPSRIGNRDSPRLDRVLELRMAALARHFLPAVRLQLPDHVPASHHVYLYTFREMARAHRADHTAGALPSSGLSASPAATVSTRTKPFV